MSEPGTPEATALQLLKLIIEHNPGGSYGKEALLALYAECLATVRGPGSEDLLAALGMDE